MVTVGLTMARGREGGLTDMDFILGSYCVFVARTAQVWKFLHDMVGHQRYNRELEINLVVIWLVMFLSWNPGVGLWSMVRVEE